MSYLDIIKGAGEVLARQVEAVQEANAKDVAAAQRVDQSVLRARFDQLKDDRNPQMAEQMFDSEFGAGAWQRQVSLAVRRVRREEV